MSGDTIRTASVDDLLKLRAAAKWLKHVVHMPDCPALAVEVQMDNVQAAAAALSAGLASADNGQSDDKRCPVDAGLFESLPRQIAEVKETSIQAFNASGLVVGDDIAKYAGVGILSHVQMRLASTGRTDFLME